MIREFHAPFFLVFFPNTPSSRELQAPPFVLEEVVDERALCVCVCVFFCCKQNQHESLKLPIFFLVLRSFQWGQNVIDRETHTSPFISHPCWQLFDYHQWKLICMTSLKGRMTVNFWWTWNSCVGLFLWCCLIMAIFLLWKQ